MVKPGIVNEWAAQGVLGAGCGTVGLEAPGRKSVAVWHREQGRTQPLLSGWQGKPWRKLMVEAKAAPDFPVGHCPHPK